MNGSRWAVLLLWNICMIYLKVGLTVEKKTDAQITWINLNLFVIEDFLLICSQLTGNRNIKVDVIGKGRLVHRDSFLLKLQCVYKNKKHILFKRKFLVGFWETRTFLWLRARPVSESRRGNTSRNKLSLSFDTNSYAQIILQKVVSSVSLYLHLFFSFVLMTRGPACHANHSSSIHART